jgi:heme/copper-type cytochrome/quinol oxidase subunit 2
MTVHKADLEAKLREIEGVVTDVEEEAKSNIVTVVVVAGVIVIGLVALVVWRSRRSKIHIEVYTT